MFTNSAIKAPRKQTQCSAGRFLYLRQGSPVRMAAERAAANSAIVAMLRKACRISPAQAPGTPCGDQ
jgi:hypothetical protein